MINRRRSPPPSAAASDLAQIFTTLQSEAFGSTPVSSETKEVGAGQESITVVPIDSATTEANFILTWPNASSDLDLAIVTPGGQRITRNALPSNVEFFSNRGAEALRVSNPQPGTWRVVVQGITVSGTQTYSFKVFADSPSILFEAVSEKDSVVFPDSVLITAHADYTRPVTGLSIAGAVFHPNGTSGPITLFDDGLREHGDLFAGDGMYSTVFNKYTTSGSYTFALVANNLAGAGLLGIGDEPTPQGSSGTIPFIRETRFSVPVSQVPLADLSVSMSDSPDPVVTGSNITYTIKVTNNGPDAAPTVLVNDVLSPSTTFVKCEVTGGTNGSCGGMGNNRTVTFSSLAANASATITIVAQADCSVIDGAIISNTVTVSSPAPDPVASNNSTTTVTTASNPPPIIVCPADRNVVTATPGDVSVVVNYPAPDVTDNCPGATVICSPPAGSSFPLGLTTVSCTVTDSGRRTASCSFKVTVWDVSIQDDRRGDLLLFNSFTGDYLFTKCGVDGFTMRGRGVVSRVGCSTKLEDDSRIVSAEIKRCPIGSANTGNATIKRTVLGATFVLKDSYILNNAGSCP